MALGLCLCAAIGPAAGAKVLLSVEDALALAFPGCEVEQRTVFLTKAQLDRARGEAQGAIESAVVHPMQARCDGKPAGSAYLDTHRVRTRAETLMVVVDPEGRVRRIELLAFREPTEYIPRDAWYRQFDTRSLDPDLELKRGIRGVTGATLTARATTDAVRRVLAIDRVLRAANDATQESPP